MREKQPAVYILANRPHGGTLYIGVTSDLVQRAWQHKSHLIPGFTQRYAVDRLVHYELLGSMEHAIEREKRLKKWNRAWKLRLVQEHNPQWRDLWEEVLGCRGEEVGSQGSPPARG